jgi:TolB-like protein
MAAQLTRTPEPLHRIRDDVPAELSAVIERALQKAPERRHATARAMLEELERVTTPQGAVIAGASAGRRDALGPALLTGAALAGLAVFLLVRGPEPPASVPDTSSAAAPVAAASADSPIALGEATTPAPVTGARAPVVLSYEDSVAISRAMQQRANSTLPIDPESLKVVFQRALSDSATRVAEQIRRQVQGIQAEVWARELGPNVLVAPQLPPSSAGKPRIVITDIVDGTPTQQLGAAGKAFADSLRARLTRATDLEIVDADQTRAVISRVPNRAAAGWTLRADLIVTGHALAQGDQMVIQLLVSDLRHGRVHQARSEPVSPDDAMAALPSLMSDLAPRIDQMARASRSAGAREPRRVRTTPPAPPLPAVKEPPTP